MREGTLEEFIGATAKVFSPFDPEEAPLIGLKGSICFLQKWPIWSHQLLFLCRSFLEFVVCALTAPVTHQDQGLQNCIFFSPLQPLPFKTDQKIFGSRPCPNVFAFTGLMVVSQPLVAYD
ncbi:MAG: hypothetical protein ACUVT6_13460 [Thermodesulfobacteriota bacterium]